MEVIDVLFSEDTLAFKFDDLAQYAASRKEGDASDGYIARITGHKPDTIGRARRLNFVHWQLADEIAVGFGVHPSFIWPQYWGFPIGHFFDPSHIGKNERAYAKQKLEKNKKN